MAYGLIQGTSAMYLDKNVHIPGLLLLFSSPVALRSEMPYSSKYKNINKFIDFHSSTVDVSVLLAHGASLLGD